METKLTVITGDGKLKGRWTGGTRPCQMESCGGTRYAIRWEDGTLTYPCSHGMTWNTETEAQIL